MIGRLRNTPLYWTIGLIGIGLDLGIWLQARIPSVLTGDALLFLIAVGVGIVATGAGLGGAVLMVPVLLMLRRVGVVLMTPPEISMLAALCAAIAAWTGSRAHRRENTVVPTLALPMGVTGSLVAIVTSYWSYRWDGPAVIWIDTAAAGLGVLFLWLSPGQRPQNRPLGRPAHIALMAATAGVGLLAGVTGMPGSFLLIPAVLWLTRIPYRHVVGTTLQAIALIATTTFAMKFHQNLFSSGALAPMAIGSLAGSSIGAKWGVQSTAKSLRVLATGTILIGCLTSVVHGL